MSQIGMMLEVGNRTIKKQKIEKETNLFFFARIAAEMIRRKMIETEIVVGYWNNDLET